MFKSGMKEAQMGQGHLLEGIDPITFRHFHPLPKRRKSLALADKYQVETLLDLCRPSTQAIDIEEYTRAFLSC